MFTRNFRSILCVYLGLVPTFQNDTFAIIGNFISVLSLFCSYLLFLILTSLDKQFSINYVLVLYHKSLKLHNNWYFYFRRPLRPKLITTTMWSWGTVKINNCWTSLNVHGSVSLQDRLDLHQVVTHLAVQLSSIVKTYKLLCIVSLFSYTI